MKTKIMFVIILMCCLLTSPDIAQAGDVTTAGALKIAQRYFSGKDVDYFIRQDNSQTVWTIFVDAEPMKGWEHECYIFVIPKTASVPLDQVVPKQRVKRNLPPPGNFFPLSVKNRYGVNANLKPIVGSSSQTNADNTAAQRTYAIIISGGVNKMSNYERYWNDCSFIYQTLVNKYGIPKANIFPIMSDGANQDLDMRCTDGSFKSQPLDLDNDGVSDIKLSATVANIQSTLSSLSQKLKEDDHLFIYVIDHGGTTDYNTNSYINLWGTEKLYDYQLANMVSPFTQKYVNVNVLLGQCYSGGFNDNLTKVGCVVASACSGDEPSWSCADIPFDEFVYQWTCAINGADHNKVKKNADKDFNGRVTMLEAFEYAKSHDRRSDENPQYVSTPLSVGEDLAFNHLAPAIDLYVMDNPEDTGKEPNRTTSYFWKSPSIWIRNKADGLTEHENPYYTEDHIASTIYVRVHNRGKKKYQELNQYVHVYWAKASTGFKPGTWMGNEVFENGEVTGGPLTPAKIDSIPAGGYRDISVTWALPSDILREESELGIDKHHFCVLAKILDTHIEPWHTGQFSYNCEKRNKDAQKNVSIITKQDLSKGFNVFVRNVYDMSSKYSLQLVPRTLVDEQIFQDANILMEMSQPIYNAWERGGFKCNNIRRNPAVGLRTVEFLSKESKLDAISLSSKEFDKVKLKFNFKPTTLTTPKYTIDLIQRAENGTIIGGETFVVESPVTLSGFVKIKSTPTASGTVLLSTDADSDDHVRWENEEGVVISENDTVEVSSKAKGDSKYYAYILSKNGEISSGSVEIESEVGISKIFADENNSTLNICFKGQIMDNSSIVISSVTSGDNVLSQVLNPDDINMILDISNLMSGIYAISYISEGTLIDTVKFVK